MRYNLLIKLKLGWNRVNISTPIDHKSLWEFFVLYKHVSQMDKNVQWGQVHLDIFVQKETSLLDIVKGEKL